MTVSIAELFPNARRLCHDMQTQMGFVERGHASADDVGVGLEELKRQLKILDSLANAERPAQRENWRRKMKELSSEKAFLEQQLKQHNYGQSRATREVREREELLARRSAAMSAGTIDQYAEEGCSILRSQRMVGEYIQAGQANLASLVGQRSRLKNVQRKVLDIANIMGLSGSLLRVSQRREVVDRALVFGGMLLTLGLLYWAWVR